MNSFTQFLLEKEEQDLKALVKELTPDLEISFTKVPVSIAEDGQSSLNLKTFVIFKNTGTNVLLGEPKQVRSLDCITFMTLFYFPLVMRLHNIGVTRVASGLYLLVSERNLLFRASPVRGLKEKFKFYGITSKQIATQEKPEEKTTLKNRSSLAAEKE